MIGVLLVFVLISCQHKHSVESWKTKSAPTCSKEGTKVGVCIKCGEEVTQTIPITDHKKSDTWTVKDEPTASSYGYKVKKCVYCGIELETELIDKLAWEQSYWKDDFGDYTSDKVALATIKGKFSNSATTNSSLTVRVYADRNREGSSRSYSCIKLQMWEYDSLLTDYSSIWSYKLKVKKPNGDSVEYSVSGNGDYLILPEELITFLQRGLDLDCTIVEIYSNGSISTTWNFTIESSGFSEAYNKS